MSDFAWILLFLFLIGPAGCDTQLQRVSYCLVGSELACSDLRDHYKTHRAPVAP